MEKQKLIEIIRKAYLSGIMEKELADKMQGFKHDFEGMATSYAENEVNNGVLDGVIKCNHHWIDCRPTFKIRQCSKCLDAELIK